MYYEDKIPHEAQLDAQWDDGWRTCTQCDTWTPPDELYSSEDPAICTGCYDELLDKEADARSTP